MEIISCEEARRLGLRRYFTGNPCKHSHLSERTVLAWKCVECTHIYDRERNKVRYEVDKRKRKTKRAEHLCLIKDRQFAQSCGLPISREDARQNGLIHYFNGTPCVNGHIANRTVSDGHCTVCVCITTYRKYNKNQ